MKWNATLALFASTLCSLGCSNETSLPAYELIITADDGSTGGDPIAEAAVEQIEIVIVPDVANGRFEPSAPVELENGTVESRVTTVGEYVLRLRRGWIDEHSEATGSTFLVRVPLFTDQEDDPVIRDPTLNVRFLNAAEERIAESNPRFIAWPPPEEDSATVVVRCKTGFREACQNR